MASQSDVARQFARGTAPESIPSASNFGAAVAPDGAETEDGEPIEAVLLSYGWAVAFGRTPDGTVIEFEGWQGYSPSTSSQMGKARRAIRDVLPDAKYRTEGRQPKMGGGFNWRVSASGAESL